MFLRHRPSAMAMATVLLLTVDVMYGFKVYNNRLRLMSLRAHWPSSSSLPTGDASPAFMMDNGHLLRVSDDATLIVAFSIDSSDGPQSLAEADRIALAVDDARATFIAYCGSSACPTHGYSVVPLVSSAPYTIAHTLGTKALHSVTVLNGHAEVRRVFPWGGLDETVAQIRRELGPARIWRDH